VPGFSGGRGADGLLAANVVAGRQDLGLELLEVGLQAVKVGAPAGAGLGEMDGVFDLGLGGPVEAGRLGVEEGAVAAPGCICLPG
jgi:hypothetical protein